ncbi:hypothetical protein KR074_008437 [Drosophila pseudoananassae]|nr:hypothetical protein KR074_008437 [Drosophila pseudoananassae]
MEAQRNICTMINDEHLWPQNAGKTLDQLRATMQPLNSYMKKRIVREGDMNYECFPGGIKLSFRFVGYFDDDRRDFGVQWEMDFTTAGHILPGFSKCFNAALVSMRPNEIAEFSIDREILQMRPYPEVEHDGVFSIEIMEVANLDMVPLRQPQPQPEPQAQSESPSESQSQCQSQSPSQCQLEGQTQSQSQTQFMGAYNKAEMVRRQAEDALNGSSFHESVRLCEEATVLLRQFQTDQPEEQEKRFKMLVAISGLLLECYEKRGNYWRVTGITRELRRLTDHMPSFAALVHEGKQHENLGELEQARETYLEALRVNPSTITIHEMIANIDAKILAEVQAGKEREAKEQAAKEAAAKEATSGTSFAGPMPETSNHGSEASIGSANPQQS